MNDKRKLYGERYKSELAIDNDFTSEWFKNDYKLDVRPIAHTKLLAHYTSLSAFYDIVETDGFWATQARFSNDDDELEHAAKLFQLEIDADWLQDVYVVSLCGQDDLLSQWRGYTQESEGVSISFDFSTWQQVHLKSGEGSYSDPFYVLPNQVLYPQKSNKGFHEFLKEIYANYYSPLEGFQKVAPYIKHPSFSEENEYRLCVMNDDRRFDSFVRYRPSGAMKIPYVELHAGIPAEKANKKPCMIRVNAGSSRVEKIKEKIHELSANSIFKNEVVYCRDDKNSESNIPYDDGQCFGCTMRTYTVGTPTDTDTKKQSDKSHAEPCRYGGQPCYLSTNADLVMISQGSKQKEVFAQMAGVVDEINRASEKNALPIKVWCEGHLPIRKIRVGNTRRKKELKEAISHFCKRSEHFWLRYVEVNATETPFRPNRVLT